MAKKKIEEAAGAAAEVKNESPVQEESKRAFIRITTTEGKTLDNVRVFMDNKDVAKVTASYGKLNPDGKNNEEKRKNMSGLMSRPLTAEQTAEFKRLGGTMSGTVDLEGNVAGISEVRGRTSTFNGVIY